MPAFSLIFLCPLDADGALRNKASQQTATQQAGFLPKNALSFLYDLFLCRLVKLNAVLQCKDFDKFHC
jgi:hypothetical protein